MSAARSLTVRTLAVLALLTALGPLSIDIFSPSLPAMQQDLGGTDALTEASITACLLGIGLGQLFWGPISDRVGRRPVILGGVIAWTVASLLSALALSPMMLIAVRGLAGVCGAAGIVVARSVVRDLAPDQRSVASGVALLSMVTAVAPVIAPVIGVGISTLWGWRADFVAMAAFGGVVSLLFFLGVPESLVPSSRLAIGGLTGVFRSLGNAMRHRELAFIALALGAQAFGFYAYVASTSLIVEREFGQPAQVFALVFGTNAAAMFGANLLFRRLAQKDQHPSFMLGVGLSVSASAGILMLGIASRQGSPMLLWLSSLAFAASMGFVLPGAHSWGQLTVVVSGAASALTGAAQFLGGVLGSPFTGMVGVSAAHLGAVIAVSSMIALVFWFVARKAASSEAVSRP